MTEDFEARIWKALDFTPAEVEEIKQSDWFRGWQQAQAEGRLKEREFGEYARAFCEQVSEMLTRDIGAEVRYEVDSVVQHPQHPSSPQQEGAT